MIDVIEFLEARLTEEEALARALCGGTVTGEPGNWTPVESGDQWEPSLSKEGDVEVLVALRPGLPLPPDVMKGYWGQVADLTDWDGGDESQEARVDLSKHLAYWDPARVLAEIASKRDVISYYQGIKIASETTKDRALSDGLHMAAHGVIQALLYLIEPYKAHPDYESVRVP